MKYLLRTRLAKDIVCEFMPPVKKSFKVMIICSGMPGYPKGEKYTELAEHFTQKGYWVFIPRYRGSWESDGEMFKQSPAQDILDVITSLSKGFVDLWDGTKYKIENPEVYLIGSSFGGPAALLNSCDKRVKKVICFSPVIDWRTMDKTVEPIPKLAKFTKDAFGMGYRIVKNGWQKIQKGEFYNPVTEIEKIAGNKCLIIHAKDDDVVSLKPVQPFVVKVGAKLVLVKKGGHLGLAILEKRFYKSCFAFLRSK